MKTIVTDKKRSKEKESENTDEIQSVKLNSPKVKSEIENNNQINKAEKKTSPQKLGNWFSSKSDVKAAWIGAITGVLGLLVTLPFNFYILIQNSQTIKSSQESVQTAREALYSSISPAVSLNFVNKQEWNTVKIQNSSPYTLVDVEIYVVKYKFSNLNNLENLKILERIQPFPSFSDIKTLKPKEVSSVNLTNFFQKYPMNINEGGFFSFVIVCKRETDMKRFVIIEPFYASLTNSNNQYLLGAIYENENKMYEGNNPELEIKVIEIIENTEKKLFRKESE